MKIIISSITGGILFLLFLLVINTNFIVALIIGILGAVGLYLILTANDKTDELTKEERKNIDQTLKDAYGKLGFINAIAYRIQNEEIKQEIKKISKSAKWILDYLKKSPQDARTARKFLNYYMDTTLNIVQMYQNLEGGIGYSEDQQAKLKKAKDVIMLLNKSFDKQIQKIVEDDFMDLHVEMEVLEKIMHSEGISDE